MKINLKTIYKTIAILYLFISSLGISYGQAVDTSVVLQLSLQDARSYSLKHNFDVRYSEKNIAIAQKKLAEIVAEGLPQISASSTLNDNLMIQKQVIKAGGKVQEMQFGTQYSLGYTTKVDQLIFNGSYIVGLQTARIYKELAKVQHEQKEVDILETVSESYYNVLVAYESKDILTKSLENLQKTLDETKQKYKEGFVEVTDVDQIQISVNRIKTSLKSLDNQISIAEQMLKYQLGISFDTKIELIDNLEKVVADASKKVLLHPSFHIAENKSFQVANLQVQMGEKGLANEKMAYVPTLSAFGQYGRTTMRDQFKYTGSTWYPSSAIGLTLNVPIFSGGARYQKVKIAQFELEQYQIQQEQLENSLYLQNSVATSNLQTSYMSYLDDKANMELSLKVYNRTQVKYEEGMASNMDLIQSYDQFLNTQNSYISRCSDLMKSYNTYEKLMTNFDLKETTKNK